MKYRSVLPESRQARIAAGWVWIACLVVAALNLGADAGPWERLGLAWWALWLGFKPLSLLALRTERLRLLTPGRVLAYILLWHGNDPGPFVDPSGTDGRSPVELVLNGAKNMVLGILLLHWLSGATSLSESPVLQAWIGLVGLGLALHLGLADWVTAFWQWRGLPVDRLFKFPLGSFSVTEFWGGRWNLAFTQLTRDTIFRPLVRRFGGSAGTLGGFLFSGILHELVVSFPAGGCYGLPTLYFLIQGCCIVVERRWLKKHLQRNKVRAWFWTYLAVLGPLPMMFHPPFMTQIVLPMLRWIGAVPAGSG